MKGLVQFRYNRFDCTQSNLMPLPLNENGFTSQILFYSQTFEFVPIEVNVKSSIEQLQMALANDK